VSFGMRSTRLTGTRPGYDTRAGTVLYSRPMYDQVIEDLRRAYDASAVARDAGEIAPWKLAEREAFLARLRDAGARRLLEVGAGPGRHAAWFRDQGLDVICTDLSPAMVGLARAKGLDARVINFLSLDFDGEFDAVFALNCLLHVPKVDLPRVLAVIRRALRPGGLFYYGVYCFESSEGVFPEDRHVPPRFFAFYDDAELLQIAGGPFELVEFHRVDLPDEAQGHFQALTLRRPETA